MNYAAPYDKLVPWCQQAEHVEQTDAERLAAWQSETVVRNRRVGSTEALTWFGMAGRYQRLQNAADDTELPDAVRSICKVVLILLRREDTHLDLSNESQATMFSALQAAGVATPDDAVSLQSLASETITLAESWGCSLTLEHFASARKLIEENT